MSSASTTPASAAATAGALQKPRPELDGLRVSLMPGQPIYLVMEGGYRRLVTREAQENLFLNLEQVLYDLDVNDISEMPPLSSDAVLAIGEGLHTRYLVSNGLKYGVPSPPVFDRYGFNPYKVVVVPPVVINAIPNGPVLTWSE